MRVGIALQDGKMGRKRYHEEPHPVWYTGYTCPLDVNHRDPTNCHVASRSGAAGEGYGMG